MNALVRLVRSLPLVIALALLGVVVYLLVSWLRSPDRAKQVLIRLFHVLNAALTALFLLGVAYALGEGNLFVADLNAGFAAVTAVGLAITLLCRWRYLAHRPELRRQRAERAERRRNARRDRRSGDDGGRSGGSGAAQLLGQLGAWWADFL
jgi:fatty acid desaturase